MATDEVGRLMSGAEIERQAKEREALDTATCEQFQHKSYGNGITLANEISQVMRDYLTDTSGWSWTTDIHSDGWEEIKMRGVYRVLAVKGEGIEHSLVVARDENEARLKVLAPLADEIGDWDVMVEELGRFVREVE